MDFKYYKIPSLTSGFIGVLGCLHIMLSDRTWRDGLAGFLFPAVVLLLIYLLSKGRAMGGGDIKLIAASGILLGGQKNLLAFLLAGMILLVFYPLRQKLFRQRERLAFGPYLSLGIFLSLIWGNAIIGAYISWPGIL